MSLFRNTTSNQPQPQRRGGCLRGILIFCAIYFGLSFLLGIWMESMFSTSSTVKLKDKTIYKLELEGTLVEQGAKSNPFMDALSSMPGYNQEQTVGLDQLKRNISLAAHDDKIKGIYIVGGDLSMAPASARELRQALLDFKQSGKWIIAYSEHYNASNYYVASTADRMFFNPSGRIAWHGVMAEKFYYTRLFDKLGVEMQVLKVGTFKSAVEPYFRTSMSEADKKQTMLYLTGIWDDFKNGVSESRNISVADLDRYADEYMATVSVNKYVDYHFVDSIIYAEQMDSVLRVMSGTKDYALFSTEKMNNVVWEPNSSKGAKKVAVIYAEGEIVDEKDKGINPTDFLKQVKKIRKDDNIKAVVLRVNSPGGSAAASEQIWHGVKTLQETGRPVVVSMSDYAASGGYYISCGADYIVAEPTTLTGSIGIFGLIPNVSKLRDRIGIDIDGITSNKYSGMEVTMVAKGMADDERAIWQRHIEDGYDLFTRRVAEGRHMDQDDVKKIAEGRVWLGQDALTIGLVDALGDIDHAIAQAAILAGLDNYTLDYYPEQKDPLDELLKMFDNTTDEEEQLARIKDLVSQPRIMMLMEPVQIK